jgi:hypothetical protein
MSDPNAQATPDERDATLATPRFDEEETVLAQPVVPLDAEEIPPAAAPTPYAPRPRALRQWPLALALISALVGGIVGGLGLYLFQQRGSETPAAAEAPAEVAQPAPAAEQAADAGEVSAPAESAPVTEAEAAAESVAERREDDDEGGDDARGEDRISAPPARDAGASESAPKHGKKGERDAELPRRPRRTTADDSPPVVTEGGARRVDSIVYPSRRAERRAERRARRAARNVDRVRAIFEGQPE